MREAVRSLRGDAAVDLERVLAPLAAGIERPAIHLAVPAALELADPERAQALVRCVQEIITNAIRHSGAEHLWIEVAQAGGRLEVVGRDDGRGARRLRFGQGLTGMHERLAGLGGSLEVDSPPAGGFRVRAVIPPPEAEA